MAQLTPLVIATIYSSIIGRLVDSRIKVLIRVRMRNKLRIVRDAHQSVPISLIIELLNRFIIKGTKAGLAFYSS